MDGDVRVVLVTVPDEKAGKALARSLVHARLAACASVVPGLTSIYRWEGTVEEDPESLVIIKTTRGALSELTERVVEQHPYDVPEVLALPVIDGHGPYLHWLLESVKEAKDET